MERPPILKTYNVPANEHVQEKLKFYSLAPNCYIGSMTQWKIQKPNVTNRYKMTNKTLAHAQKSSLKSRWTISCMKTDWPVFSTDTQTLAWCQIPCFYTARVQWGRKRRKCEEDSWWWGGPILLAFWVTVIYSTNLVNPGSFLNIRINNSISFHIQSLSNFSPTLVTVLLSQIVIYFCSWFLVL